MFQTYLQTVLPSFEWFKSEKQLYNIIGYDAADALLETLREHNNPAILIESLPDGALSFEDGFLDNRIVGLWVMEQVKATDQQAQNKALNRCFERGKSIIKHLVHDSFDNEFAATFDTKNTPYFPRMAVAQFYYGYEFLLTFRTDIDMLL